MDLVRRRVARMSLRRTIHAPETLEDRRLLSAAPWPRPLAFTPLDTSDPRVPTSEALRQPPLTANQVFNLSSKPDSNFTIYLDYDGHVTSGTSWNDYFEVDPIVSPPFDLDGNPNSFNQTELERIVIAWQRTAEDYAPFDINVTTRDPGIEALRNTGGADTQWGVRAIVTVDNFAACGCGGFAFLESFADPVDTPTFIFNWSEDSMGETFAHEVGHMVGLNHDGTNFGGQEYYRGHGTGTLGWGAIMGAPFTQNVTQWDQGEYFDASNQEDDFSVITTGDGFGFRDDDYGNTRATAANLNVDGGTNVHAFGILERNTDIDYFRFETGTGAVSLDIQGLAARPNVDLWAGLYNATGALVAQSNPSGSLSASFTNLNLTAGVYHLRVEGIGSHDTYQVATDSLIPPAGTLPWTVASPAGYSGYGSVGQYRVQGTIVAPVTSTSHSYAIMATDAERAEGSSGQTNFTFTVSRVGDTNNASSVDFTTLATLPDMVGQSYPYLTTPADFAAGTTFQATLSFAPQETSKTLVFSVLGDTVFEPDESFDVVLSNPSAGGYLGTSRATGTILSDESLIGIPVAASHVDSKEGPFQGALVRWRQVGAANGAFDEWAIDNVSLSGSSLADDFDPDIDFSNWSEIANGTARTNFTGSAGKALFMSGGSDRRIVTRILHAAPGDVLSFRLIFGNGTNGGENADPGEDVFLEYSLNNGSSWSEIAVYDTEDYTTWTNLQATLPIGIDTNPPATMRFTIARDGGLAQSATVNWSVETNGLASPADPADFVGGALPAGQATFAAGEASTEIVVAVQGDLTSESDENFRVRLTSATGSGTVRLDPQALTGQGTILNDDPRYELNPGPQFRWRQLTYSAGNFDHWAIDNLSLSNSDFADDFDPAVDGGQWTSIHGGTANANFTGTGNSLFFSGTGATRAATTRRLSPQLGDTLAFDIIYGNNSNGGDRPETGEEVVLEYSLDDGQNWILIGNYPLSDVTFTRKTELLPAGATVAPPVRDEGNTGTTEFPFVVKRTGLEGGTSEVAWSVQGVGPHAADAADFPGAVFPSGIVTFAPGETSKTILVPVNADTYLEPDETFQLSLGTSGGISTALATIRNDDTRARGDFNADGLFNCFDLNDLVAGIVAQTGLAMFDLNGDSLLNPADVDAWLALAGAANLSSGNPYLPGDANLDGAVDVADFNVWNNRKFTVGNGWCGGDFNIDGATDGGDFGIWNAHKFTSALRDEKPTSTPTTAAALASQALRPSELPSLSRSTRRGPRSTRRLT